MNYRSEFPDFDPATLPPIPAGWSDTSWHNNTCPSFAPADDVEVFVDYADEARREMPGGKRFVVMDDGLLLIESDDWAEILKAISERP